MSVELSLFAGKKEILETAEEASGPSFQAVAEVAKEVGSAILYGYNERCGRL